MRLFITQPNTLLYYITNISFLSIFFSELHNTTNSFMLPYKVYTFFDITNTRTYILMYLYLFPMLYASICHMAAICLMVILVFHICGELSILSYRIRNIQTYSQDMVVDRIRSFVRMHLKIVWWVHSEYVVKCNRILACKIYNDQCINKALLLYFCPFFLYTLLSKTMAEGWRNLWTILLI